MIRSQMVTILLFSVAITVFIRIAIAKTAVWKIVSTHCFNSPIFYLFHCFSHSYYRCTVVKISFTYIHKTKNPGDYSRGYVL